MNSIINLFIYEVKGPTLESHPNSNYWKIISMPYSFDGLVLKNKNDPPNTLIVPKELKNLGGAIMFVSYTRHKVTPITKGIKI